MSGDQPPIELRGLSDEVADRVGKKKWGPETLSFLRTARVQIRTAASPPDHGLRLAETAAYALREALDSVTQRSDPAPAGLPEVLDAWDRYLLERGQGEVEEVARTAFEQVIERNRDRRNRDADRERRLITELERETGLSRLPGRRDPVEEYKRLRQRANALTHGDALLGDVVDLYNDILLFFERLFMPPTARHDRLVALARLQTVTETDVEALEVHVARNAHDLSLFFSNIESVEWIEPLWEAGLIEPPRPNEPWPMVSLIDALGERVPDRVVELLDRLLGMVRDDPRPDVQLLGFDGIARASRELGAIGVRIGLDAIKAGISAADRHDRRPGFFKFLAVEIARQADADDDVVAEVADLALAETRHDEIGYRTPELLAMLTRGVNAENAKHRLKIVAGKVGRLAREPHARFADVEGAALTTEVSGREDPIVVLSHGLAVMLKQAHDVGIPSADVLELIASIEDPFGSRLRCQVLATATDVALGDRVAFLVTRLSLSVPTGDDVALIDAIASTGMSAEHLAQCMLALGTPSERTQAQVAQGTFPEDWARAWRWSAALPATVLVGWDEQLGEVTATHGTPTRDHFTTRTPSFAGFTAGSPHSTEELSAISVLDAAKLISEWRTDDHSAFSLQSARELGRTLEEVIAASSTDWTIDPMAIINALHHPTYVDHYFRGVTKVAREVARSGADLVRAAAFVSTHPWDVEPIGNDDFEYDPDWHSADAAAVDMLEALANNEAEFDDSLIEAWALLSRALRDRPQSTTPAIESRGVDGDEPDPLTSAINRPYSSALEAVIALGWWEVRHTGTASENFVTHLDEVIGIAGWVGLEFRAIIAQRRPALEAFAQDWLETNRDKLFGTTAPDGLGGRTFDLTLKWTRRTSRWFLETFRSELYAAARRQVDNAVSTLLVGMLWGVDGFEADTLLDALRSAGPGPTTECAEDIASLMQPAEVDPGHLVLAVEFWRALMRRHDAGQVPTESLEASGRWAFVTSLDEATFQELMLETLVRTRGIISLPVECVDRLATGPHTVASLSAIRQLPEAGASEPWERHHVQSKAVEIVRSAAQDRSLVDEVRSLRDRLLELGRSEVRDVEPPAEEV